MSAKRRKRRKTGTRKRKPVAKRSTKRRKKRKVTKRRKRPVAHAKAKAKPVKRRKKRKLSAAHLAKMQAGRKAALHRKRSQGPVLRAKVGESARGMHYHAPPKTVRLPIRNPGKAWYKFCTHGGSHGYSEQIGYGTRQEAEAKAKALLGDARKIELLGPYQSRAMATKAA